MTNTELRRTIRQHKGAIFVTVCGNNDVHHIRAVKSDLLAAIENIVDHELEARATNGDLYIDRAEVEHQQEGLNAKGDGKNNRSRGVI